MKKLRAKAEKLANSIIKLYPCVKCGNPNVDPAHLYQHAAATVTDLRCIVPLCRKHHNELDQGKDGKYKFRELILGDLEFEMLLRTNTPTKVDWSERVEFLKDVHDRIKEGELTLEEARSYETQLPALILSRA